MSDCGKDPVNKAERSQAKLFDSLGFVTEVGKYLEDGFSDLGGGVDEQSSEVVNFVGNHLLTGFFSLLDQGSEEVNACLYILVGLSFQKLLNDCE